MKKFILCFIVISASIVSCKDDVMPKPKNLIERDKMVAIIYDLSLLEAVKSQNGAAQSYPKAIDFLKDKYKIDSITFAKSSQYYASDMKEYKKMYDEVKERLNAENAKLNGGEKKTEKVEEKGIVK